MCSRYVLTWALTLSILLVSNCADGRRHAGQLRTTRCVCVRVCVCVCLCVCVCFTQVIRHAEALSQDIGFECGLVYLANRLLAEALTTPNPTRTPHNPQRTWLPPPRPAPAAAPADVTAALSSLSLHVTNGPAAADIHAAAQRQKRTARLTAVMPCKDIDLTGRALCCVLLALFCQWNPHYESTDPLCAMSSVVTETGSQEGVRGASECGDGCRILAGRAVASLVGEAVEAPPMTHHKVWVLIQYLREYRYVVCLLGLALRVTGTRPCTDKDPRHVLTAYLADLCVLVRVCVYTGPRQTSTVSSSAGQDRYVTRPNSLTPAPLLSCTAVKCAVRIVCACVMSRARVCVCMCVYVRVYHKSQVAYHLAKLLSSARESTKDGQPGPLYFVTDVSLFVGHGGANTIKVCPPHLLA